MGAEKQTTSIKKAVIINFFGKYTNIFVHLIYGAILARILTPEDFGIVAVVTVFTTLFTLIANMGIGPAIIQNKQINDADNRQLFSLTIYIGLAISLLFALLSYPIALWYGDRVYIPIGCLLSISLFFNTINIVPNALLLKDHRFMLVNIRLVAVTVLAAIPTILFALAGFKYYAIVIQSILVSVLTFLWNYYTVRLKPSFRLNMGSFRKIREFSTYQFAFSLVNYFSRNLDNLLIGKFIGSAALGFYDKSYRLMLYPVHNLTNVITPVLHPILSVHQDDKAYIYEQYMKVVKILSLLGAFISAYSFFAAKEIIIIFYGSQWYDAVPTFRILSLSMWAQMITSSTGAIFQSIGNTKLLLKTGVISSVIIVGSILIGISFGSIERVAILVTIAYILNFVVSYYNLIHGGLGRSWFSFIRKLIPDFIIFAVTFSGLYVVAQIQVENLLLSALLKLLAGGILYLLAIILTKQFPYVRSLFSKKKQQ